MSTATIEQLQRIINDENRSIEERRTAAEHILRLQQRAEWAAIPDDDPEVISLMERVEGAEYLTFWPEYKNRTLEEAKEVAYLRRVSRDTTKTSGQRTEAEQALMAIRRKLRGDGR